MMKNHVLSLVLWCVSAVVLGAVTILIPSVSDLTRNLLGMPPWSPSAVFPWNLSAAATLRQTTPKATPQRLISPLFIRRPKPPHRWPNPSGPLPLTKETASCGLFFISERRAV